MYTDGGTDLMSRVLYLARLGAIEQPEVRRFDPGRAGRPGSLGVAGRESLVSRSMGRWSATPATLPTLLV